MPGLKELILALDGKFARRSGDRADGTRPLNMVSAYLVREGLTVAQEPCDSKSNEITALPRLLDRMHLEGAVVTIDAAGCQRDIVQALQDADADYVLALKGNQGTLHRQVKAAFDAADRGDCIPEVEDCCETVERNGGRHERRICTVLGGPGLGPRVAAPEAWPGLRSLVRVQAERNGPRGRQRSVRYYITSRPADAAALLELVRGHWGVENGLHRTLDMQFREDDCRMRKGHAPAVMAILRRAALNMVRTIQRKLETDVSIGAAARPHRTPALAPGRRTALKPTLRLPWVQGTHRAASRRSLLTRIRSRASNPATMGLAGVVAVPHEDMDVGHRPDIQGPVEQGQHGRHLSPWRAGGGEPTRAADSCGRDRNSAPSGPGPTGARTAGPGHPAFPAVPAVAGPGRPATALGDEGAVAGPGRLVCIRHHRAQPRKVERRKVAGPGRLPAVRVGAAVAEAGQVAVGGTARQASQLRQQVGAMVPLRFAEGQIGQYSGQQEHGTPPEWHGVAPTP